MTSKPQIVLGALLLLTPMLSCGTSPTPVPQAQAGPAKAVPCVELPSIAYHAPKTKPEVDQWLGGDLADISNSLDTPDTVQAVRQFNAARDAVCGP